MIRILEGYKLEKQQFSGHTSSALFPEISWLLHEVQTPRRSKIHKYCAEWLMASCNGKSLINILMVIQAWIYALSRSNDALFFITCGFVT